MMKMSSTTGHELGWGETGFNPLRTVSHLAIIKWRPSAMTNCHYVSSTVPLEQGIFSFFIALVFVICTHLKEYSLVRVASFKET